MDTNMMDVDGDIILDVDPTIEAQAMQTQDYGADVKEPSATVDEDAPMPAAYYETLETFREWPETLNIQGVNDFGPNGPMDYALEHCPEPRPKRQRWVNDSSVNLEYYSAADAQEALLALTHPEVSDAKSLPAQTARKARYYSQNPDSDLVVREANTGDQKQRNAADRSEYYKKNPQAREQKVKRREQTPPPIYLDYGDEEGETRDSRSRSVDEGMYDSEEESRPRRGGGYRNGGSYRNGPKDRGRLADREVDSYRPSENGPRESHYGRLRNRSASPSSDLDDGRFGFAEDGTSLNKRYRSRSRDRDSRRRRSRTPQRRFHKRDALETNRWEKDRGSTIPTDQGRWLKNGQISPMSHHRRSDAGDETHIKGSLLSRMTKDGKPLAPQRSLSSRITRDGESGGSLASRITRDDEPRRGQLRDDNYGRLKDDFSEPTENSFQEPTTSTRDLASRITWARDGGGNRRRSDEDAGYSIRGSAPQAEGFSIRGAAGGE